ncbi:unnamed protein product [Soboliphyme baturini]|uniref:Uncharacterized protein n=1 Tax=Soboliphyme baturini TaxID=241478 RepID=A0A183IM90_9BILA|nr:unnamed protein product [Soboliphyme baturini]
MGAHKMDMSETETEVDRAGTATDATSTLTDDRPLAGGGNDQQISGSGKGGECCATSLSDRTDAQNTHAAKAKKDTHKASSKNSANICRGLRPDPVQSYKTRSEVAAEHALEKHLHHRRSVEHQLWATVNGDLRRAHLTMAGESDVTTMKRKGAKSIPDKTSAARNPLYPITGSETSRRHKRRAKGLHQFSSCGCNNLAL